MFRIGSKFPYHGLSRIHRHGPSRLYLALRYQQTRCPDPASAKKPGRRGSGGGGGTGFYYTIGTITLVTGATVAYAKYDPDFRAWLKSQAPWTDSVVTLIFQEEKSWGEVFNDQWEEQKLRLMKLIYGESLKSEKKKKTIDPCLDIKEKDDYKLAGEKEVIEEEEDLSKLPSTHPKNLVDLESKIADSAKIAITSYRDAICALREHTQEIYNLVEDSIDRVDAKVWSQLKIKTERKERTLKEAEEKAEFALLNVNKLKDIIEDKTFDVPENLKSTATRNVKRVIDEINIAQEEMLMEKKKSSITDKYWKQVEKARRHYMEELEILFPNIKLDDKEFNIASHDLDLFILHAFQNVLFYQKELSKLEILGAERIRNALDAAGEDADQKLIRADIETELEKDKRSLSLEFQKKTLNMKVENEKEMRLQLKRQAEAHTDHLTDAVALREKELEREFLRQQEEKLAMERDKFKYQLAGMMGRLKGLESSLSARANADKNAHQAQLLWSACQSLFSSLKNSNPNLPWMQQLKPLEQEILAVKRAALENDELVDAVLAGIPSEATKRGVFSEDALRERFLTVERVARRLALVSDSGASLPIYFLSYMQSLLLIRAVNPIPQSELADEPIELTNLDTYDILQRARYWMDRGDFSQTLRYMNLLKGASRTVSRDWMNETRILLETQQAATALMAHAAASGLLYI